MSVPDFANNMRAFVSLLLIVLLVDTRARASIPAEVRAASRRGARHQQAITNKRAKTSVCERAFRCSGSGLMDSTDPDVSVTPISYALSNHRNVHDKLASYGHAWSTIDIFFKCVVSRRLQRGGGAWGRAHLSSCRLYSQALPCSSKCTGQSGCRFALRSTAAAAAPATPASLSRKPWPLQRFSCGATLTSSRVSFRVRMPPRPRPARLLYHE